MRCWRECYVFSHLYLAMVSHGSNQHSRPKVLFCSLAQQLICWLADCLVVLCGIMVALAVALKAQPQSASVVIKGKVLDKQTQEPVVGATVMLVPREESRSSEYVYVFQDARTSLGALASDVVQQQRVGSYTRKDGTFELKILKPGPYTLTVRSIGYKKFAEEVFLADNQTLSSAIALVPDIHGTDAVVVTGVASKTRKSVAEVAVSRVDADAINQHIKFTDATQLLVGKVAGLSVQPSNGSVGAGVRLNIRSNAGLFGGQPTIFIDGVRSLSVDYYKLALTVDEISPLVNLNPDDIEAVEVLKGPTSGCLYGTATQNGIVVISTKRGRPKAATEQGMFIGYQYLAGWQEASRLYTEDMALTYESVNQVFQRGPLRQHAFNIRGASEVLNYYAAFDIREESGILPKNLMRRLSGRVNVDVVPTSDVLVSLSANLVSNDTQIPLPIEQGGLFWGWLRNTLAGNPSLGKRFFSSDSAAIAAVDNGISMNAFLGSAELQYTSSVLPGLRIRGLVGTEITDSRALTYFPPGFQYNLGVISPGLKSIRVFSARRMNVDVNASYAREWLEGLTSNVIVGMQLFDNYFTYDAHSASDFPTLLVPAIQTARSRDAVSEIIQQFREAGIFGRVESNYLQTYFFSFGVRNDYATSLGKEASSIFYPQMSAAVRLDRLGWLPEVVNLVKPRIAYGESGRLPSLDQSRTFFRLSPGPGSSLSNVPGNQLFINSFGNPAIRPERIQELEVGVDLEVEHAYGMEFTYFLQTSRDVILGSPPATSIGVNEVPSNIGSIDGWGFETMLYATPINNAETQLRLTAMLTYADNRVLSIGQNKFFASRSFFTGGFIGPSNYITPGLRRGEFMDRIPLEPRFRADGYYNARLGPRLDTALSPLGSSVPLYTGSLALTYRFFRDVTFYAMVDIGWGKKMLNLTRQQNTLYGNDRVFNKLATQLGLARGQAGDARYEFINPVPGVQPLEPNTPAYRAAAEAFMRLDPNNGTIANFLESADWLRLREISVRWNLTPLLTSYSGALSFVRECSVTVAVRNAALWTNYSGIDIEYNAPAAIPTQTFAQASDTWVLMQPRTVQFMVSLGF